MVMMCKIEFCETRDCKFKTVESWEIGKKLFRIV